MYRILYPGLLFPTVPIPEGLQNACFSVFFEWTRPGLNRRPKDFQFQACPAATIALRFANSFQIKELRLLTVAAVTPQLFYILLTSRTIIKDFSDSERRSFGPSVKELGAPSLPWSFRETLGYPGTLLLIR